MRGLEVPESGGADMEASNSLISNPAKAEEPTWLEKKKAQVKTWFMTTDGQLAIAFFSWVAIGGFALTHLRWGPERKKFTKTESIYWMAQIITTVGYGDMPAPIQKGGEIFITLYCLAAGLVVAAFVTALVHRAVDMQESMATDIIKMVSGPSSDNFLRRAQTALSGSPTRTATPEPEPLPLPKLAGPKEGGCVMRFWHMITCQGISSDAVVFFVAFGQWVLCVIIWALFYRFYPGEDKYIVQAFYMAVITLTTIGFGDVTPSTEVGRLFASVMMVVGVTMFAKMVGKFSSWMLTDLTITELTESTLSVILEDESSKVLMKERKAFFDSKPELEVLEQCVSRSDFILFMLKDMDLVQQDDIQKLSEHFDFLDKSKNGFLEVADLPDTKFYKHKNRPRRAKTMPR